MKKLLISISILILGITVFAQQEGPILTSVDKTGSYAIVTYGSKQIQLKTVYPGHAGNGLMVTPPVKPVWDKNGNFICPAYFPGMSMGSGTVWIVEGAYAADGKQMGFSLVEIKGDWAPTLDLNSWLAMYPAGTDTPPQGWYKVTSKVVVEQQDLYTIFI